MEIIVEARGWAHDPQGSAPPVYWIAGKRDGKLFVRSFPGGPESEGDEPRFVDSVQWNLIRAGLSNSN